MKKSTSGFTIVELIIVVVVIAILAAVIIVGYSGIRARGQDSKRHTDLEKIMQLVQAYHVDHSGYPRCNGTGPYQAGTVENSGLISDCLADELVPAYVESLPVDPVDVAPNRYYYAVGYRKDSATTYDDDQTDNFILGATMNNPAGGNTSGWSVVVNHLLGSANE